MYRRPFHPNGSSKSVLLLRESSLLELRLVRLSLYPDPRPPAIISPGAAGASAMIREMLTHLGLRKTMAIKTCIDAVALGAGFLQIGRAHV